MLGEWQRDRAREETIPAVIEAQARHGGGSAVAYAWETELLAGSGWSDA